MEPDTCKCGGPIRIKSTKECANCYAGRRRASGYVAVKPRLIPGEPSKWKRKCAFPGCKQITQGKLCRKHHHENIKVSDEVKRQKLCANSKRWADANRERLAAYRVKYTEENRLAIRLRDRKKKLKRAYGLSEQDALDMLEAQGGKCAICRKTVGLFLGKGKGTAHIDHDHDTGKTRKILCPTCNTGLGSFGDSSEMLETAAKYLRDHGK